MLERGNKMFSCFLGLWKAFDTVWIDGLMYKLFSDLGVKGKLWLAIKDLCNDTKALVIIQVHYLENLRFHRVQGRGEHQLLSCIKFT